MTSCIGPNGELLHTPDTMLPVPQNPKGVQQGFAAPGNQGVLPQIGTVAPNSWIQYNQQYMDYFIQETNRINNYVSSIKKRKKLILEDQYEQCFNQSKIELASQNVIPWENRPDQCVLSFHCVPPFNFDILPQALKFDVYNLTCATGWDPFACLLAILGSVSIALWGRYVVRLGDDGLWKEPVVTYLCILSPSGNRKSSFVKFLRTPFACFQQTCREEYNDSLQRKETYKEIYQAMKKGRKNYIKELCDTHKNDIDTIFNESIANKTTIQELEKRISGIGDYPISIFMDSGTPKMMIKIMRSNGEVGSVFEPELSLLRDWGREKKTGMRVLLKSYDMEALSDLTNANQVCLLHPALNIIYVIQPESLKDMYKEKLLSEIGLLPRFNVYFADKLLKGGKYDINLWQAYCDKILYLLKQNYTREIPRTVSYINVSPDANSLITQFQNREEQFIKCAASLGVIPYIKKLHGNAVRWAALAHCYAHEYPEKYEISPQEMELGIAVVQHLFWHANYAFAEDGLIGFDLANEIIKFIKYSPNEIVSSRMLQKALGGHINQSVIFPLIVRMAQHNLLRYIFHPNGGYVCILHPQILSSQNY